MYPQVRVMADRVNRVVNTATLNSGGLVFLLHKSVVVHLSLLRSRALKSNDPSDDRDYLV